MVYDVLYLDDRSFVQKPYEMRREQLESLRLDADHWQIPPFVIGRGPAMLDASRDQGMEASSLSGLEANTSQGSGRAPGSRLRTSTDRSSSSAAGYRARADVAAGPARWWSAITRTAS
jgi:bifunctional non-homologous end joining protein LigD